MKKAYIPPPLLSQIFFIPLLLVFLCPYTAQSQWTVYNTGNSGIGGNVITAVAASPDSSVWIAAKGSVSHFKNSTWKVYGADAGFFENDIITDCSVDAGGNPCFALNDRIVVRNGNSWTGIAVPSVMYYGIDIGACVEYSDRGTIWYGCHGGFAGFDGLMWETHSMSDDLDYRNITDIEYRDGLLMLAQRGGILLFDGSSSQYLGAFRGEDISACTTGESGTVSAAIRGEGVAVFDGTVRSDLPYCEIFEDSVISCLAVDSRGRIWAGCERGAARFEDGNWIIFQGNDDLPHNHVLSLCIDGNDRVWIGTVNGLACYTGE